MSVYVRKIIMFGESSVSAFPARSYDVTEDRPPYAAMTSSKANHI
jgi:hypothetical protein